MYLTDNLINLPKERIYFLYLLDLVHAAENKLWETQLPVPVSRKGRLCGSFLLYRRLCTLADKTLEALWKDRMAEKNPLTRFDARLASTKEQTEAAAELLRRRLAYLRRELQKAQTAEEIFHLKRRIAELSPMLTEMNELAELTAHYYDRGYYRSEKYTL